MKTFPLINLKNLIVAVSLATLPLVAPASESPSELLEKGIYAEDTKGDLTSAITIYQQLVAEASSNQIVAAQGQYRLALCYQKNHQTTEAKAAFEKLIEDYPKETVLIAKAREHLPDAPALLPVPWVDGERLQLNITMGEAIDIGAAEYRVDLLQTGGSNVWQVGTRVGAASTESVSSVDLDPDTFRPISSHWKHSLLGDVTSAYQPGQVEFTRSGKTASNTVKFSNPTYDNEEAVELIRRLPLKAGYKSSLTVFSSLSGSFIPVGLEVTGQETVETPAGNFTCFKVQLSLGQTFWYSTDEHRYVVKFEANSVTALLNQISVHRADESAAFTGPLGVTLTIPPGWVFYSATNGQPRGQILIRTFDPEADAEDGGLRLYPTETLAKINQKSARDWAENHFNVTLVKALKNLKMRPNTWQDYQVDSRTGSSYVADFTSATGKPRTLFSVSVLGKEYSEHFVLICAPDKLDGLKAEFDQIIASYHKP